MDTCVHAAAPESVLSLTVKRNCSISPRALLALLGFMMLVSFGIGTAFAWFGAWMILPFAGIEMLALAGAFYLNGRHATDFERFALAGGRLIVEICDADRLARHEFNPSWVRLEERYQHGGCRVMLRSSGKVLEIGRHLDAGRRLLLAARLRHGLSNC